MLLNHQNWQHQIALQLVSIPLWPGSVSIIHSSLPVIAYQCNFMAQQINFTLALCRTQLYTKCLGIHQQMDQVYSPYRFSVVQIDLNFTCWLWVNKMLRNVSLFTQKAFSALKNCKIWNGMGHQGKRACSRWELYIPCNASHHVKDQHENCTGSFKTSVTHHQQASINQSP